MQRFTDSAEFLRCPIGSQLVAANFAYWYPHRALTGFALWGSPDSSSIEALNTVMDVVLRPEGGSHRSLVDMQHLGAVDPLAFCRMAQYVASRWQEFGRTIQRQAIVRPSGYSGALVAGFFDVVSPAYPVKVFSELSEAVLWLGIEHERALLAGVEQARRTAGHCDPVVALLRAVLTDHPGFAKLSEVARKLGLSERTLQRRLHAADTTFHEEVHASKLEEAQRLMLTGGLSVTRIALELGFASPQHFSALFRKRHGLSPTGWLRRRSAQVVSPAE